MNFTFKSIPRQLKNHKQWVCWKYNANPKNPKKPKKPPINPKTGELASVTEPKTWSSFKAAVRYFNKGGVNGIGVTLTKEMGITSIDIDGCRNKKTGEINAYARKIMKKFPSYTEISPSGTGIHIFLYGALPGKGIKTKRVEVYDRSRYMTVTGNHVKGSPLTINMWPKRLKAWYAILSTPVKKVSDTAVPFKSPDNLSDVEIIAKLFQGSSNESFSRLYSGDTSNYTSPSEADLAFCSHVSGVTDSPDTIDRIFRTSGLLRSKWDEPHGDQTYGAMTIATVLANPKTVYNETAEEKRSQYEISIKVVEQYGRENIFSHAGQLWLWEQLKGIWRIPADEELKQAIHRVEHRKRISLGHVNSILGLIKTEVYSPTSRFSKNANRIINCKNGEVHFEEGNWVLKPHNRDNNFCHQISVNYDPDATCEDFDQFVKDIFATDDDMKEKIRILQEFFGYALTTSCEYERMLILLGTGSNGKSVLLVVLKALVGKKHAAGVQLNQLENKYQLAHLYGKLANIITELPEGAVIADAKIKAIASGETMTAEFKYGHPFDFEPYSTLIFSTNHLPHTKDCSPAFFRRVEILTFNREFAESERDTTLKDELQKELPGVLNFALRGLKRLYRKGDFTAVPSSKAVKRDWELAADQVTAFIEEECELCATNKVPIGRLYEAYKDWAIESGIKSIVNKPNLTARLKRLKCTPCRGTGGIRMLSGITLKSG